MKTKKSLGQNFLTSKDIARDIVDTADISESDTVLEVGPGKGFLTEELLKKSGRLVVVEKDYRLIEYLDHRFSKEIKNGELILIHEDILNLNSDVLFDKIKSDNYKVVANIPYYITGQLLRMFLERGNQPQKMVLMLQKEVAERIVAKDGKESILSVSVKAYGKPKVIKIVPAEHFNPKPKVDSAVLSISNISKKHFIDKDYEKGFFRLVKQGFLHKRKTLLGNLKLKQITIIPDFEKIFNTCNIQLKLRAERLSVEDWLCIQNSTKNNFK